MAIEDITDRWSAEKALRQRLAAEFRSRATTTTLSQPLAPLPGDLIRSVKNSITRRIAAEPYWFHKIELAPGLFSPGWSNPSTEKLPFFGLPDQLAGKRVLDIGCAEGFFSFEAERRGAREVIGIDSFPDSIRRFNIVKEARQSNATAYLMNVYDLDPPRLGTFDVVLFYGVFYHLKHPQYALEKIKSVCTGQLIFQTLVADEAAIAGIPWARYYPYGLMSGKQDSDYDPTVFWAFNSACCIAMLEHVGFIDIKIVSDTPKPFVLSCGVPDVRPAEPPDQSASPWS